MLNVIFDMESNDPDDFLTLLLLAGHPQVNLKAVTVFPGSADQIGLVRHALHEWFQRYIPIGAGNLDHPKPCVSEWHYAVYSKIPPSREAAPAAEILHAYCDEETILITGAALTNLASALNTYPDFRLGRLMAQGGFAGEGVVPPDLQMEKFKGLTSCPTFNLNGNPKAAKTVLETDRIETKYFVSKNVCHRVIYDSTLHARVTDLKKNSKSLQLIWQGMEHYLLKNPHGKMLHDPLAACCAINPAIGTWGEVEIYKEKNGWGSRLALNSKTWIIIDYYHEKFLRTFLKT